MADLDPLLRPLVEAASETEARHRQEELIKRHAEPVVRVILRRKLGYGPSIGRSGSGRAVEEDARDLHSLTIARTLVRLRQLRANPKSQPIADFINYVAVATHHACDEYFRSKHPQRARLKNRLYYVLKHRPELALWRNPRGDWLAGLAAWQGQQRICAETTRYRVAIENPVNAGTRLSPQTAPLPQFLEDLFAYIGGPVEFNDVVAMVAKAQGATEWSARDKGPDRQDASPEEELAAPVAQTDIERRVIMQQYTAQLWKEIRQLPAYQRRALLLNFDDLDLFPVSGTATLDEIAHALELSTEELAAQWNALPLDDNAIAQRLGITRQQVINLRKCARERLARRMKGFEEGRKKS